MATPGTKISRTPPDLLPIKSKLDSCERLEEEVNRLQILSDANENLAKAYKHFSDGFSLIAKNSRTMRFLLPHTFRDGTVVIATRLEFKNAFKELSTSFLQDSADLYLKVEDLQIQKRAKLDEVIRCYNAAIINSLEATIQKLEK
jgi:hypothetical protein